MEYLRGQGLESDHNNYPAKPATSANLPLTEVFVMSEVSQMNIAPGHNNLLSALLRKLPDTLRGGDEHALHRPTQRAQAL